MLLIIKENKQKKTKTRKPGILSEIQNQSIIYLLYEKVHHPSMGQFYH